MSTVQVIADQISSVIDNSLLERKAAEAKLPIQDVELLDLHSHKIAMIENLWQLGKLTVLKLNDNCIEEIENLDALVNLRELNLSYNRISKIQNLEKLVHMEKLLLHSNRVKVLEKLDSLQNLQLFSISNNAIESVKNVIYLRRLKCLKALSMDGNAFCSKELDYKDFILTFLPNLRYYEYNLINGEDRIPKPKYRQLLTKVEEDEMELYEKQKDEEEKRNRRNLMKNAFVDTLEPAIILEALEWSSWKLIMQIGGEVLCNFQKEHREQVEKVCKDIQDAAISRLQERDHETTLFKNCVQKACQDNKQQSLKKCEDYMFPKEEICEKLRQLLAIAERKKSADDSTEMDRVRTVSRNLMDNCEILKDELLILEIELQEQIEGVISDFSSNMKLLVEQFRREAKEQILHLQELELVFHQSLINPVLGKAANLRVQGKQASDSQFLSKDVLELANDPTNLMEQLINGHDKRMHAVLRQEIKLNTDCEEWLNSLVNEFKKAEFHRGRARIMEISTFVSLQQQEMTDLLPGSSLPSLGLL